MPMPVSLTAKLMVSFSPGLTMMVTPPFSVLQDFFEVEAALANLADLRRDINVKG